MLSVQSELFEDLIYYAKPLAQGQPVFMLNGYEGDRLVVKRESTTVSSQDMVWLGKVMGSVDRAAKPKLMTQNEVQAMQKWAHLFRNDQDSGARDLELQLRLQGNWVKMKVLNLVSLDSASLKRGTGDKTDVRLIASTLNAAGGLEQLGAVVAADLFNGNGDRFSVTGGNAWQGMNFQALTNVGNVFVSIDPNQKATMIGLDPFDRGSRYSALTGSLTRAEKESVNGEQTWTGVLLRPDHKDSLAVYADRIIADLNLVLGPRDRKLPFTRTKRLTKNASQRLVAGMTQGAEQIRERLVTWKQKHGALPLGLSDRVERLAWRV